MSDAVMLTPDNQMKQWNLMQRFSALILFDYFLGSYSNLVYQEFPWSSHLRQWFQHDRVLVLGATTKCRSINPQEKQQGKEKFGLFFIFRNLLLIFCSITTYFQQKRHDPPPHPHSPASCCKMSVTVKPWLWEPVWGGGDYSWEVTGQFWCRPPTAHSWLPYITR